MRPAIPFLLTLSFPITTSGFCLVKRQQDLRQPLEMGGYYNDPDIPIDQSETHMVFGIRCVETMTSVRGTPVVGLQPADSPELEYGPALVQYMESRGIEWKDAQVVEVGASSTCLALAREASSVVVCHSDPQRLQILQHAHQFLNEVKPQDYSGSLETRQIAPDQALPSPVDLILLTSVEGLDRLEEALAMEGPPRILVPSVLIPPTQLQNYKYNEADGILEVLSPL